MKPRQKISRGGDSQEPYMATKDVSFEGLISQQSFRATTKRTQYMDTFSIQRVIKREDCWTPLRLSHMLEKKSKLFLLLQRIQVKLSRRSVLYGMAIWKTCVGRTGILKGLNVTTEESVLASVKLTAQETVIA